MILIYLIWFRWIIWVNIYSAFYRQWQKTKCNDQYVRFRHTHSVQNEYAYIHTHINIRLGRYCQCMVASLAWRLATKLTDDRRDTYTNVTEIDSSLHMLSFIHCSL